MDNLADNIHPHDLITKTWLVIEACMAVGLYAVISALMMGTNKYLLDKNRFPHCIALVNFHLTFSFVLTLLAMLVLPRRYADFDCIRNNFLPICKRSVPLSLFNTLSFVVGNAAYAYAPISVLQMIKGLNLPAVYIMCLVIGLERFNRRTFSLLLFITVFTSLAAYNPGHAEAHSRGVIFQLIACFSDCMRLIITELLLNGEFKMDTLSTVVITTPVGALLLGAVQLSTPDHGLLQDFKVWWPLIVCNGFLAFLLNIIMVYMVVRTSAVGYNLSGIIKNVFCVTVFAMYFHEKLLPIQIVCYSISTLGILVYSMAKLFPEDFKISYIMGMQIIGCKLFNLQTAESVPILLRHKSGNPQDV